MSEKNNKIILNTFLWGLGLWLFGWVLGIVFFFIVPENLLGLVISPLGIIATLWVLFKKVKRDSVGCYLLVGVVWTVIAVVCDYLFLVKLFGAADYYKADIYFYYTFTLLLPVLVGWLKLRNKK